MRRLSVRTILRMSARVRSYKSSPMALAESGKRSSSSAQTSASICSIKAPRWSPVPAAVGLGDPAPGGFLHGSRQLGIENRGSVLHLRAPPLLRKGLLQVEDLLDVLVGELQGLQQGGLGDLVGAAFHGADAFTVAPR